MKSFFIKIFTATGIIALIGWLVFSFLLPQYYVHALPFTLLFFLIVTICIHWYELKLVKRNLSGFTRINMLLTFFKLIIYSIFAVVHIALIPEHAVVFVICLMILYLVFSFIEITELAKIIRNK